MPERPLDRRAVVIAGHAGDQAAVRSALGSSEPAVRASALGALARLGGLDETVLAAGLADESADVVRRAIAVAARRVDHDSVIDDALLAILTGADAVLAEAAAWALGERHEEADPASVRSIVVALAAAVTGHQDALVREAAVAALGSIGSPDGRAAVLSAVADKATVRRRAVLALAAFDGPEVDAALERARTDRDWQVRQAAEDLS